jgi:hypothetical protein
MADQVPGGMLERTHGFAGARFFDAFTQHPERRAAFIGFASEATVGPLRGNQVAFWDVVVEEYRGQVGGTPFIEPDLCHFIPIGIADAFIEAYAPADYVEAVNEVALPRYAKSEEMQFGKGVLLETQQNVLPLCTVPRALFTSRVTPYRPPTVTVETGAAPAPATAARTPATPVGRRAAN